MIRTIQRFGAAAGLLLGLAACQGEELFTPPSVVAIDPMFARYVSIGNSITAGFQSGGINDLTQSQAYPVLLARAMQSPFFVPWMTFPGCPSPYTNVFTRTRVFGGSTFCALRRPEAVPPPYISNVAVPGAEVIDVFNNLDATSNANALTVFFLGGLTQMQMVERAQPTFASVWIGNNDVLGAVLDTLNAGNPALVTAPATFQARYTQMLDDLAATGVRGAVLIGVANVTSIPFLSRASTYYSLDSAGAIAGGFTAAAACQGPAGDGILVPFPFGGALIAAGGTLNCTEAQTIQPAELANLVSAVTAYNAHIQTEANNRGWAYLNPNTALDSLRLIPAQVAPFPTFGAACTANPFGLAFSCDAVHPSAATHRLIANYIRAAINAKYTSAVDIPVIP
jgi:GDSL-like lipase/acylhydrolase family protein